MVELMLILSGLALLATAVYLEIANRSYGRLPAAKLAKRIVGSQYPNLISYSIIVVLIVSGLHFYLLEWSSYTPFLFIVGISVVAMLVTIAGLNKFRFESTKMTEEEIAGIYFEAIEDKNPEEGIDYIIEYIQNPKWGVPERHLRIFLTRMAKRDDEYGRIASKRMAELGISNDESS